MTRGITNCDEEKRLRLKGVQEHTAYLGPQTVHFDITNNCNVRCTTCWHHSPFLLPNYVPTVDWKRRQMSFSQFQQIFDDLISLGGLRSIILSGMGDPSLNPELVTMVQYARGFGIDVTIITNLLQLDLPSLLANHDVEGIGKLDLLASICGATAKTWNAFHAMPQGYDRLLEQLRYLKEKPFLPKHVQVINSQNYHELDQMVRFAVQWPAKRVNFKFASLAKGTEAVSLQPAEKQRLSEELIPRAKAVAQFYEVSTDLGVFATQVSNASLRTAPIEKVGCYMGTIYARITVEGELLYCCNTEITLGFLSNKTRFRNLWDGERYRELRSQLGRGEFFDSCQQCGKYKQNHKWAEKLKPGSAKAPERQERIS